MKKAKIFLFFMICICLIGTMTGLHNIDLAWNTERGMIDYNGVIEQTPEEMYNRAYLTTTFSMLILILSIFGYEVSRK